MKKVLKKSKSINDEKTEPNDVDDETKSEAKECNEESENQTNDEETVSSVPLILIRNTHILDMVHFCSFIKPLS